MEDDINKIYVKGEYIRKIIIWRNILRLSILTYAFVLSLTQIVQAENGLTTVPESTETNPKSSYTLTKVVAKGENTITKFEWNETTKTLESVYYRLDLKKTSYGEGNNTVNLKWNKAPDGVYILGNNGSEPTAITIKYDTTNLRGRMYNATNRPDTSVIGTFYNNSSRSGGAIYNYSSFEQATLGNINADFIKNSVSSNDAYGGAIANFGNLGNIAGNFIQNSVQGTEDYGEGGAIYNYYGVIGDITGNFIGNSVNSNIEAYGGAVVNALGTIGDITGDFIGNYAYGADEALGGAIDNDGTIGNITGNFVGNSVIAENGIGRPAGGAIYNEGRVGDITGDFIGNYVRGENVAGGAICNYYDAEIGDISGDFIGNYTYGAQGAFGGAIYNEFSDIGNVSGDFIGNYAYGSQEGCGGAIYNSDAEIGNITGDFIGNYAYGTEVAAGGAIFNYGDIDINARTSIARYAIIGDVTGNFIGNYAQGRYAVGGAIVSVGTNLKIVNSSFYNNYATAVGEGAQAAGGAIAATNDVDVVAKDGYISVFKGNYTETNGVKDDNAIVVVGENPTVKFKMENGGKFVMADNIRSLDDGQYGVVISGDNIDNTTFYMQNNMYNASLTTENTTINTINNSINNYALNSFTLGNNTKMAVDVDLANQKMDRFTANEYGRHNGNLTVTGMNLLSDAPVGRDTTEILFAEVGLKDNVINGTGQLPDKYQTAYTPIYKYNVGYENKDDGGYFVFERGGLNSSNPSDNFNPSVLSTPVANQAGNQAVVNETVRFAFQHMDLFSQLPFHQRISMINNNKYALSEGTPRYNSDFEMINKGFWIKPFTSFEKINVNNGPDVDAVTYGTLIGVDSKFKEMKRGWYNVQSLYAGYNGSQLSYGGVDTSLNGGMLGLTETFYKGNFFSALTATAGANVGTSSTMYGNEDFTSLIGGIGAKSGYNFEFKDGKYILQPILFMNYSFVNTFDYTSASGVKIDSDPLHTLQINPQLKFVSNLKNGWQPYANVGFVWNILNSSKVRADDVILPKMSVDPYIEYGLGIQRNWGKQFTGYAQAMVRNGGRNGVALTFGFRYAMGKDNDL